MLTDFALLSNEYKEYSLGRYLEHLFTEKRDLGSNMLKRCDSFAVEKSFRKSDNN